MTFTEEQASKLQRAEEVLGYSFSNKQLILSAITHPSATEGRAVKYSYERLEFLGDSILAPSSPTSPSSASMSSTKAA